MWLGCLLLAILPTQHDTHVTHCTCVEINHVHNGDGDLVFSQLIVWQGADCQAWRMLAKSARPIYRWRTGYWESEWIEDKQVVCVRASAFRETWTQYDREMVERDYCPECQRRKLIEPKEDAFQLWGRNR